ncbi:phosphotransferase enzyme family protein [Cellulomonas pakistanensis]|uniref:Aminoglycoside phosphotransferase n=1 Tax=Cellulomonas pakistanensis TaxID=992287 RepID=A0A919PDA1_9CELL|nr:phosphotransferase [Cellulomonas pakistanensis]GIG37653.1 aminoglycoside phosphotransferase [Cellulomonas pakistanensis]
MTTDDTLGSTGLADPGPPSGPLAPGAPAPRWLHAALCAAWGWDPARTTVDLLALSHNATFRVSADGAPVAVTRVARPAYMDDTAAVESEVAWMTALGAAGTVRVPTTVPPVDGRDVAMVADPEDRHWVCLTWRYLPGAALDDVLPGLAHPDAWHRRVGTTAARLHEHALAFHRPRDFVRPTWEPADMVGPDSRWGAWEQACLPSADLALLGRARSAALDALHDASRAPDAWGLVHADLRPGNLLVDGDDLTVLDFDDCGFSWFVLDLAAALSYVEHLPDAPGRAQAWVAGYQEVRPLTRQDARTACALSMLRRLQLLGRTVTDPRGGPSGALRAEQPAGSVLVAERYLRDPAWLLA